MTTPRLFVALRVPEGERSAPVTALVQSATDWLRSAQLELSGALDRVVVGSGVADQLPAIIELLRDPDRPRALRELAIALTIGPADVWLEIPGEVRFLSGRALARVSRLVRLGWPGDVLVSGKLAREVGFVTRGRRLGAGGRRAFRIDLRLPYQSLARAALDQVDRSVVPRGTPPVSPEGGQLVLVRAGRGEGVGAQLQELAALSDGLLVTPARAGEPFGPLRSALAVSRAEGRCSELTSLDEATLEGILAGDGTEPEAAASLLASILGPGGVVLLDDIDAIDGDTLEAASLACIEHGLALVARLEAPGEVPPQLARVPALAPVNVTPLNDVDAAGLVDQMLQRQAADGLAEALRARAGSTPAILAMAVLDAVESGDVYHDGRRFRPRRRLKVRGGGGWSPERIVARRLGRLSHDHRWFLDVLTAFGGSAPRQRVVTFAVRLAEALQVTVGEDELEDASEILAAEGWVLEDPAMGVRLSSRGLAATLATALATTRGPDFFRALASCLVDPDDADEVTMTTGTATLHAVLAGDWARAAELAGQVAQAADMVGSASGHAAYQALAQRGDARLLVDGGLCGILRPLLDQARASRPPVASFLGEPADAVDTPDEAVADAGTELAALAAAALRRGDVESLRKYANDAGPGHEQLADRLRAMAQLATGETSEALRKLRQARDDANREGSAKARSRAALAHGVALAAAGRTTDSLLEVLASLARVREAQDPKGEHACARFLAKITRGAGFEDDAARWDAVAARAARAADTVA